MNFYFMMPILEPSVVLPIQNQQHFDEILSWKPRSLPALSTWKHPSWSYGFLAVVGSIWYLGNLACQEGQKSYPYS